MTDSSSINISQPRAFDRSRPERAPRPENESPLSNSTDSVSLGESRESSEKFDARTLHSTLRSEKADLKEGVRLDTGKSESAGSSTEVQANRGTGVGYDESFLGEGMRVPLPSVTGEAAEKVLTIPGTGEKVRHYTHFSIVMNKERKLAFFTASNIDGPSLRDDIKRGKWEIDEVIGAENQTGNSVYSGNSLDKGHMVRRRDVVWGSKGEASKANQETFYYTNAVPQHGELNQKKWLDLENWLLQRADQQKKRLTVFTGPVLSDGDVKYRGEKIPEDFWKIIVLERESDHKLTACAFMMSQKQFLRNVEGNKKPKGGGGESDSGDNVNTSQVAPYQVTLAEIEKLTSLDFSDLKEVDAYALFQEEQAKAGRHENSRGASPYLTSLDSSITEEIVPELFRRYINAPEDIVV
ncbi:MAG: DNA/RNA non-specific endonuclease [Candidatus Xenobiia bacterium LiM19]